MRPSLALDLKRSAIREAASRFRTANPRVLCRAPRGSASPACGAVAAEGERYIAVHGSYKAAPDVIACQFAVHSPARARPEREQLLIDGAASAVEG